MFAYSFYGSLLSHWYSSWNRNMANPKNKLRYNFILLYWIISSIWHEICLTCIHLVYIEITTTKKKYILNLRIPMLCGTKENLLALTTQKKLKKVSQSFLNWDMLNNRQWVECSWSIEAVRLGCWRPACQGIRPHVR